jgi:hypothetical protein
MTHQLFRIITLKDEIVVAGSAYDTDAATLARQLVAEGSLDLTLYGIRHAEAGGLEHAPLRPVAVLAHDSLRIEPYESGLPVAEH